MKPQECDVYEGLNETILSVSLSAPRPGIFLDTVKYVLVLGKFKLFMQLIGRHQQNDFCTHYLSISGRKIFFIRQLLYLSSHFLLF